MMAIPDRAGRFKASPLEWSISETGKNNLTTFIVRFGMKEWKDADGTWYAIGGDITGYFFLEKKDGSVNTFTVDNLKEVFGWDGRAVESLHDGDWSALEVQLTLENETYEGKTRLKVRWMNRGDDDGSGGFERADAATVKTIGSKLGAKLRALNGSPVAAPKPGGKPPPPPAAPQPVGTGANRSKPPPALAKASTRDEAWAVYAGLPNAEQEWGRMLAENFPSKHQDSFTAADWQTMADAYDHAVPF